MKPELSPQNNNQEVASFRSEASPDSILPELRSEAGQEVLRDEYKSEKEAINSELSSSVKTPVVVTATDKDDKKTTAIGNSPVMAADEDLIEKEWVDRAKKIVDQTQGDPYQRDEAVNVLKNDYLKKRYGKELGSA